MKLTDLDYLTGNHHLQMMKAALPYMEVPEQRMLSVFVKINELQRTISLFEDEEVASMGICSLEEKKSPADMLKAIKPYGNTTEQDFIDLFCSFLQGGRMFNMFQGTDADGSGRTAESGGEAFGGLGGEALGGAGGPAAKRSVIEQLRGFLSPEQQSKLETAEMMMQAMQQFT